MTLKRHNRTNTFNEAACMECNTIHDEWWTFENEVWVECPCESEANLYQAAYMVKHTPQIEFNTDIDRGEWCKMCFKTTFEVSIWNLNMACTNCGHVKHIDTKPFNQ